MESLNTALAIIASCLAIIGTLLGIRLTRLQLRSHSSSVSKPPSSPPSPTQSRGAQPPISRQFPLQELEKIQKKRRSQRNAGVALATIVFFFSMICIVFFGYGSWPSLFSIFASWHGLLEGAFPLFGLPFLVAGCILWIIFKRTRKFIEQETYGQLKNDAELEREIQLLQRQQVP